MTVIAAMVRDGVAAMAADSMAYVDGLNLRSPGKIVMKAGALVGLSGDRLFRRPIELFDEPCPATVAGVEAWCWGLSDAMHQWARARGHGTSEGGAFVLPCCALVATPVGLWRLSGDGMPNWVQEPYAAVGSGQHVAMGALFASMLWPIGVRRIVELAALAAIEHSDGCGGPVDVHVLGSELPVGEVFGC